MGDPAPASDPASDPDPAPAPAPDPAPEPEPAPEPAPATTTVTARVSVEDLTVDERRPPSFYVTMMQGAVREPLEGVLECYRARLADAPTVGGDLRLRMWVSARRVIRVTPEQDLADAELQTCAVARIRTLTLPSSAPRAGASVRLTLRFATGPRSVPSQALAEAEGPVEVPAAR